MHLIYPTIYWASGTYGNEAVKRDRIQETLREHEEYELGRQMEGSTAGEALLLKGTEGGNLYN